jgi:ABC-type lipoprotein export system ATPase subunit
VPVAQLTAITFSYPHSNRVLDGVDLTVHKGESVAIVGPSGSGKSTLLAVLGLLQRPRTGVVAIAGTAVPSNERARRALRANAISWVFQTVNVLPRRTAADNVALGLLGRGTRRGATTEPVQAALDLVGIGDKARRRVHELSGGELQRVGVARALVRSPELVIADEPTGQLDHASSIVTIDALLRGAQLGAGIIVATHDVAVAARCDRTLRLVDGILAAS